MGVSGGRVLKSGQRGEGTGDMDRGRESKGGERREEMRAKERRGGRGGDWRKREEGRGEERKGEESRAKKSRGEKCSVKRGEKRVVGTEAGGGGRGNRREKAMSVEWEIESH